MKDFKDKKLGDDQLEEVNGGVIFNASGIIGSDPNMPWEVLDNRNGNVLCRFSNKADAERQAKSYGGGAMDSLEVDWNQVLKLRGQA